MSNRLPCAVVAAWLVPLVVSMCSDTNSSCGAWAKNSHCADNPECARLPRSNLSPYARSSLPRSILSFFPHALVVAVMKRTCPRSCGVCEHICADANATCVAWAIGGECDSNADFMLRHCPTSCGICTPECKDRLPECAGWANLGECAKNPDFANRNCPVSCGVCKSQCKDTNSNCGAWSADGACDDNPGFMYVTCPLACGVCSGHPGECDDVSNATECRAWADHGACVENPGFMARHITTTSPPHHRHITATSPLHYRYNPGFMARELC